MKRALYITRDADFDWYKIFSQEPVKKDGVWWPDPNRKGGTWEQYDKKIGVALGFPKLEKGEIRQISVETEEIK